jgi:hypothetical protein
VIFQTELLYLTRAELFKLLHQIACELLYVPQGSVELRADKNRLRVERWRGRTCGPADNGPRHDISVIAFCPSAFKSGRIEVVAPGRPQLPSPGSRPPADLSISSPVIYPQKLSIFSSAPPLPG